jgi:hypothetical protein
MLPTTIIVLKHDIKVKFTPHHGAVAKPQKNDFKPMAACCRSKPNESICPRMNVAVLTGL